MTPDENLAIDVVRRSERLDSIEGRKLQRAIAAGEWVRIIRGSFTRASDWHALTPIERHRTRVIEICRRMSQPCIVSHFAAAAAWGIDVLGAWPRHVDVTCQERSGGRSSGSVRRHTTDLATVAHVPWGRHWVTTPAQTAADLARTLPFIEAVASLDQAIWQERDGGALASKQDVAARLTLEHRRRGDVRALRAVESAEPLAANVRESQSRVVIAQLGFPTPRLQERRILRTGRLVFGDFYFPDADHWGELDGRGKYTSPQFANGRSVAEIVIDEKERENEIRREVRGFSRWEPGAADWPRLLYDILTGDGLRSRLPRP